MQPGELAHLLLREAAETGDCGDRRSQPQHVSASSRTVVQRRQELGQTKEPQCSHPRMALSRWRAHPTQERVEARVARKLNEDGPTRGPDGKSKTAGEHFAQLLSTSEDAFFVLDADWRITFVSSMRTQLANALTGRSLFELGESAGACRALLERCATTRRAVRGIEQLPELGPCKELRAYPTAEGGTGLRAVGNGTRVDEALVTRPERQATLKAVGDSVGYWDAGRLGEIVQNLVGNALQHTTEDIVVQVRVRADEEDVLLEVHNGGPAIPAAELPLLFAPFRRGRAARGSGRSMGLGLYITAHIVEAHGGTVDVRSKPQEGTTFTVRLPRGSAPHEKDRTDD